MKVYKNLEDLPILKNAVLTIGSFDGVHRGHQKILARIHQLATNIDGKSVVITFHPHPRIVLRPDDPEIRMITTIDEKIALMESFGIDVLVIVPFNKEFHNQSPDEYIENFLIEKFHPRYIVIGYDHRFGKNRAGDIHFLKKYQAGSGFEVIEIEKQEIDHITISSSKIRVALDEGDIETANQLLGHNFLIRGTVVRGAGIGNTLGFPTANTESPSKYKLIPREGIYAIRVHYLDQIHDGVLYIGTRPTLISFKNRTIEAHIFDFKKDIYGDQIGIEFISYIRSDMKFDGLEALTKQMEIDSGKARLILQDLKEESLKKKVQTKVPEVAIVILNYNGRKWFEQFIPSVLQTQYEQLKIIVADNASTDDSLLYLEEHFPSIEIIRLSENHGFAKGYNEALKEVDSPYLVLLNSDVEVPQNWLAPIIDLMETDDQIAACQPKILAQRNKAYFEHAGAAGGMMDLLAYPFCKGRILEEVEQDEGQYDEISEIFWASGAAMVIRNHLYKKLEGFDEDYFAHQEEIDLCWRLKRAGFKIMVHPGTQVYHYGGGTLDYENPRKVFLNFRNSFYSIIKNEPLGKLCWLVPTRLLLDGLAGLVFLLKGQFKNVFAIIQAHFSMYGNIGMVLRKRKHYAKLIQAIRLTPSPNMAGRISKSIIWQYYIRGKKHFKDL